VAGTEAGGEVGLAAQQGRLPPLQLGQPRDLRQLQRLAGFLLPLPLSLDLVEPAATVGECRLGCQELLGDLRHLIVDDASPAVRTEVAGHTEALGRRLCPRNLAPECWQTLVEGSQEAFRFRPPAFQPTCHMHRRDAVGHEGRKARVVGSVADGDDVGAALPPDRQPARQGVAADLSVADRLDGRCPAQPGQPPMPWRHRRQRWITLQASPDLLKARWGLEQIDFGRDEGGVERRPGTVGTRRLDEKLGCGDILAWQGHGGEGGEASTQKGDCEDLRSPSGEAAQERP
jgi:hypothetical protein